MNDQAQRETIVPLLKRALLRIRSTPPRAIASPPTQPRKAAVAILIRVVPAPGSPLPPIPDKPPTLSEFFDLEWVNHPRATPQVLFLHRETSGHQTSDGSLWQTKPYLRPNEAHVAFPGGRQEPDDEGGLYTAMRQTWEEVGIDLAEQSHYALVGQLDDREITTSLGKRLLMILSPFVFLQISPPQFGPLPEPIENTSIHWTPLSALISQKEGVPSWTTVTVDAASRVAPKHSAILRVLVRLFIGSMQFPAILLPPEQVDQEQVNGKENEKEHEYPVPIKKTLKLWGLSLGMTLDLMSYMILPNPSPPPSASPTPNPASSPPSSPLSDQIDLPRQQSPSDFPFRMEYVAPSLASVFPRFSYPDVNFWIWVFGKRYRQVIRGWEASIRAGGTNDRRINWSGSALSSFYAAIRKALVVVLVLRALGLLFGVGFAVWWVFS